MVAAIQPVSTRSSVLLANPPVTWFAPQPLWTAIPRAELPGRRGQPVILRFAGDDFMDELTGLLASNDRERLADYVAQRETWQNPRVGWDASGHDRDGDLKLYQPSQNRFYLVAGALACRIPGIPDRTIDRSVGESVFFVLRRVENGVEYGWSTGKAGEPATSCAASTAGQAASGTGYQRSSGKGWVALADPDHARLCDEERFPLFPLSFGAKPRTSQNGATRRLLAGLIPVASRETYQAGPALSPFPSGNELAQPGGDPRPTLFEQQVTGVLQSLQMWRDRLGSVTDADRRQIERITAYAMLDLMAALSVHVKPLYDFIMGKGTKPTGDVLPLSDLITGTKTKDKNQADVKLSNVLKALEQDRDKIEALAAGDSLDPSWVFPWADGGVAFDTWLIPSQAQITIPTGATTTRTETVQGPKIQGLYQQALSQPYTPPAKGRTPTDPTAALAVPPEAPKLAPGEAVQYVIRLVYDRPQCPFPIISQATRPFSLASFFDPDAPARPIRIAMPVDTSPEGLRKFPKGVSFQLSNQLRAQMARVTDLKKLMDGEAGEPTELDLGMLCSFSIPIITIVALILLMIFVQLLNIIFWWLPFFKICLPLKLPRNA
jgi:hypothetical protein